MIPQPQDDKREIEKPRLARHRAAPAKFDCETAAPKYCQTPKHLHRAICYESRHLTVLFIKDRFDQHDYNIYMNLNTKMNSKLLLVSMATILNNQSCRHITHDDVQSWRHVTHDDVQSWRHVTHDDVQSWRHVTHDVQSWMETYHP